MRILLNAHLWAPMPEAMDGPSHLSLRKLVHVVRGIVIDFLWNLPERHYVLSTTQSPEEVRSLLVASTDRYCAEGAYAKPLYGSLQGRRFDLHYYDFLEGTDIALTGAIDDHEGHARLVFLCSTGWSLQQHRLFMVFFAALFLLFGFYALLKEPWVILWPVVGWVLAKSIILLNFRRDLPRAISAFEEAVGGTAIEM